MRRRLPDPEGPGNDRWLVSYADFVTVLFGFFVFLYAVSSAEQDQVQRLSEAVEGVFKGPPKTMQPIAIGEAIPSVPERFDSDSRTRGATAADRLKTELGNALSGKDAPEGIALREGSDWVEIVLPGDLVFESGDVSPGPEGLRALERVAGVVRGGDTAIVVEGFTDNLPIRAQRFPSNWELSAARAAVVVRELASQGVAEERLGAMGYGANHPVARNDTERGRAMNRRVVLVIATDNGRPPGPARR